MTTPNNPRTWIMIGIMLVVVMLFSGCVTSRASDFCISQGWNDSNEIYGGNWNSCYKVINDTMTEKKVVCSSQGCYWKGD